MVNPGRSPHLPFPIRGLFPVWPAGTGWEGNLCFPQDPFSTSTEEKKRPLLSSESSDAGSDSSSKLPPENPKPVGPLCT